MNLYAHLKFRGLSVCSYDLLREMAQDDDYCVQVFVLNMESIYCKMSIDLMILFSTPASL